MPLPLIPVLLGGAALASAAFGAKKGYDAYKDTKTARAWHEEAKEKYERAERVLKSARKGTQNQFEALGRLQADIVKNELTRYADLIDEFETQNNVNLASIVGRETMNNLAEIRNDIATLGTTLGAIAGSATAGAFAGFGAFGGATLIGSASTGTALSALSGAAATKATLAWFGGGSLAAGGLGIAGGTFVLGGIVAAPVIAVAASVFAASAEKRKYEAEAYYDSVSVLCEAMRAEAAIYDNILNEVNEKISILETSKQDMPVLLTHAESAMQNKGCEVSTWSEIEQKVLEALMQLAETTVITINAPIMHDENPLTIKLKKQTERVQDLMEDIQREWGS